MAGGMWYTWHFSAKGQLSGRRCQREERRVRSWLLMPTPLLGFFFFFFSPWDFLASLQSPYLSLDQALGNLDNSISLLHPSYSCQSSPCSPPTVNHPLHASSPEKPFWTWNAQDQKNLTGHTVTDQPLPCLITLLEAAAPVAA